MLNNIKWHKIHGLSETVVNGKLAKHGLIEVTRTERKGEFQGEILYKGKGVILLFVNFP
jgi:hypothetical protein